MKILTDQALKGFNTFNLEASARMLINLRSIAEVKELIASGILKKESYFILGGGSNVLFSRDFDGLIIRPELNGIEIIKEDERSVTLRVGAGEVWEDLVKYTVENNWGGIENLALIPGNAGAAPIQNIGAYGTEIKDVLVSLEAMDLQSGEERIFKRKDCHFDYRYSIFKGKHKGRYLITSIDIKLKKNPKVNLSYRAIKNEFEGVDEKSLTIKDIFEKVVWIRESKLPDPEKLGNAGSFFKNPVIPHSRLEELSLEYSDIVNFPHKPNQVKLAAAWLIDRCGWKGKRFGDAAVHENQALVLVNHGNATGEQIVDLAIEIQRSVFERFGVELEFEINII